MRLPTRLPASALVALAATLPYFPHLGAGLAGDDLYLVRFHPTLRSAGEDPGAFFRLFGEEYWGTAHPTTGIYRPVTTALLSLCFAIGGETPLPYHALSIALHAACSLAALAAARALLGPGTGSLVAGLLFALHPIHTESVADAVNVGELVYVALGLVLVRRFARRSSHVSARAAAVDGALFLVALLAKEGAVALLLILPAAAACRSEGNSARERLRDAAPALAALAIALAVDLAARTAAIGFLWPRQFPQGRVSNPLVGEGFAVVVPTALWVFARSVGLLLWPARLSVDYSAGAIPLVTSFLDPRALLATVFLLSLLALGIALRRSRPVLSFATLGALASLLPTSNLLVRVWSLLAERHLLFGTFFVALAAGAGIGEAAHRVGLRGRSLLFLATGLACALCVVRTVTRLRDWRSEEALWTATATSDSPPGARALFNHAVVLDRRRDAGGARAALRRAVLAFPDFFLARTELGRLLEKGGDLEGAVAEWRAALEVGLASYPPTSPEVAHVVEQIDRVLVRRLGRPQEGAELWETILARGIEVPAARAALARARESR